VLVVVQQPGDRLLPLMALVEAVGESAGVLADQVVHPVAARAGLGEQVLVVEIF